MEEFFFFFYIGYSGDLKGRCAEKGLDKGLFFRRESSETNIHIYRCSNRQWRK